MSRFSIHLAETKAGDVGVAFPFMNPLISDPAGLELRPEVVNAAAALVAEMDSAAILEAIQARESSLTPVMQKILESRPSSHWGINE